MEEEKSEPINPFANWPIYVDPWERLERRTKCEIWKRTGSTIYDTDFNVPDEPNLEFTPRVLAAMEREYFTGKGKLILPRLRMSADKWIFWTVTQGLFRMGAKNRLFVFQGPPDILMLRHSKKKCWVRAPDYNTIIADITNSCNTLKRQLMAVLNRYDNTTKAFRVCRENFKNMPDFVWSQGGRNPAHRQRRWKHMPRSRGGNQPDLKPYRSEPNPQDSIKQMLEDYHQWLNQYSPL